MKDDLISRKAAIDAIRKWFEVIELNPEILIDAVRTLPSARPEIIRCKDCAHYYFTDNRIPQEQRYVCELEGERWKPDDYCSYAERRTDGSD